jgi:hypothetical protein
MRAVRETLNFILLLHLMCFRLFLLAKDKKQEGSSLG